MARITSSRGGDRTIGVLSRDTGVKIETIRYYERIGILPAPPRTEGGHRVYPAEDVRRLTFVRRARELGFSLGEVRELLRLAEDGGTCGDVKAITLAHAASVARKIADLDRLRTVLADMAATCEDGRVPDCPIIEALSA
ncbi:MAG: MerR family transcriptional regulator [Inquilinaceae bacterium]